MIRDPSDGSVREKPEADIGVPTSKPHSHNSHNSGLRQPTRTDAQERLEESRKWLKTYHAKKEST